MKQASLCSLIVHGGGKPRRRAFFELALFLFLTLALARGGQL